MKILVVRPNPERTCEHCNSDYEIEKGDLTAHPDILCGKPNPGAPDFHVDWNCPVCGGPDGSWLYLLPGEWRADILRRSPDCHT